MSINALEKHPSGTGCSAGGRAISLGDTTAVTVTLPDRLTSRASHFPMKSQHEVLVLGRKHSPVNETVSDWAVGYWWASDRQEAWLGRGWWLP